MKRDHGSRRPIEAMDSKNGGKADIQILGSLGVIEMFNRETGFYM